MMVLYFVYERSMAWMYKMYICTTNPFFRFFREDKMAVKTSTETGQTIRQDLEDWMENFG